MGAEPFSENQRSIMIADAVFSHLAHHRGQFTVYLRLLDSKVPAIYGLSAVSASGGWIQTENRVSNPRRLTC